MIYNRELYNLEIKYAIDTSNPTLESWIFICEDLKTNKEYTQQYHINQLIQNNKILSLYPNMFSRLIKDKEPTVEFKDTAIISWIVDIPFGDSEVITLNIMEKSTEGVSDEIIELQQCNRMLVKKVAMLEQDLAFTKNTSKIILNAQIKLFITKAEFVKLYIDYGIDIKNNYDVHQHVYEHLIWLIHLTDEEELKSTKYDFIRELIKYGYSVTNPILNPTKTTMFQYLNKDSTKHTDIDFSILVHYVVLWICDEPNSAYSGIPSEKWFGAFEYIIKLIIPTANLNVVYGTCGTIIQILQNHITIPCNNFWNNFCSKKKYKAIEYLKSLGAK